MKVQNCPIKRERKDMFARTSLCRLAALLVVFVSAAGAETFHKTRMVDGKGREQPVDLAFDSVSAALSVKAAGEEIFHVPYGSVQRLSYEQSSRHRVKEGAVVMIFSLGAGGVVMLTKSNSHWLYVDYRQPAGDVRTLTLKLDKGEYKKVLETAASQTGKTVETPDTIAGGSQKR